jgi:hypothetical protein
VCVVPPERSAAAFDNRLVPSPASVKGTFLQLRAIIIIAMTMGVLVAVRAPAVASARTVEVIIENRTDKRLVGIDVGTTHGEITTRPPQYILPGQTGRLVAESNGFATGTEGTVKYRLEGVAGEASFHFDNPFAGSNSFDSSAPDGYATDHTIGHSDHTVVFFFIRSATQAATVCNGPWVISHLGTHSEDSLNVIDEGIGFGTTPLKRLGIQGWVDTGCVATAVGTPVRDAQHSTDGFWTIDMKLTSFTAGEGHLDGAGAPRFVRIEVEPDTPAHAEARASSGVPLRVTGRVLIDTHHGEQLIEIHPYDPMVVVSLRPYGLDTCAQGYVWREAFGDDHVCVPPTSRQRAVDDNAAAASRRAAAGGAYGPDTCAQGFVWREATPADHICVTPQTRSDTADENRLGPSRRV